ncbi:MAG TPA: hypothetical protein ENJ00_11845 [Phycisphaerales bacterium]|nr:hypothetical protein [Phycisphaerales bacterium]
MSSIGGAGLIASVAAVSTAERQVTAKKTTEKRDEQQLRKKIRDRVALDTADIEQTEAVVAIEQDDESPADSRREKRPAVHKQPADTVPDRPSLDIQA